MSRFQALSSFLGALSLLLASEFAHLGHEGLILLGDLAQGLIDFRGEALLVDGVSGEPTRYSHLPAALGTALGLGIVAVDHGEGRDPAEHYCRQRSVEQGSLEVLKLLSGGGQGGGHYFTSFFFPGEQTW